MGPGEPHPPPRRDVDRRDAVGGLVNLSKRIEQIGARRAELRLAFRDLGLHHAAIGEPHHAAWRLATGELDKRIEHAAREPERDRGNPNRIQGLLRERVKPPRLATKFWVLAR